MDFAKKKLKPSDNKMKPQFYWKYNYLVNWCKLDYEIEDWTEFEEYFSN